MPLSSNGHTSGRKTLPELAPLEAVLFDIDGTLCDSDPIHYHAFREMFIEIGYNNGIPITEEFYAENISGKHNDYLGKALFPDWSFEKCAKFLDDKEAMFRRLAPQQLKAVSGLYKLCKWVEDNGLKCAAVTNAPKLNAELMISILGLDDFFPIVVLGPECERAKPFPDPYLRALKELNASPQHTFVFEDSVDGIKAGVAAGMPVVGVTTRNPEQSLIDAGASLLIKDFEDPKLWTAIEEALGRLKEKGVKVVFVLGGPGSGKGTQCENIVRVFGFTHLSAGDLLRAEIKSGSENGTMIQNMIKEGKIVPSEVTIKLLEKAMLENGNDKFLIDGFPRNEENRAAFEEVTKIEPEFVLFFDCPEKEMERRLLGRNQGRDDDNIETIRKRFEVFIESSLPVIEYYNLKDKVRKVDAAKPVEDVFESVKVIFSSFSKKVT